MNNTEYVEKMFTIAERILVDTCTLMKPRFHQFVSQNKGFLKSCGKPIVVIKPVYAELHRKMLDDDEETAQAAMDALELLDMNKEIFQVECSSLTKEEIENAFADPYLLSDLTLSRNKWRQLLIVNDRELGEDAYNLNFQASCKGRKVYVCFVDRDGKLQPSDCVCSKENKSGIEETEVTHDTTIQVTRIEKTTKTNESNSSKWGFDWKSGLLVATGTIVFYGVYRLIKAFI